MGLATDNRRGERVLPGYRVRVPHGAAYGRHGYGIVSLRHCDLFVAVLAALPEANVLQTGHPNIWKRVRYDIGYPRAGLGTRLVHFGHSGERIVSLVLERG